MEGEEWLMMGNSAENRLTGMKGMMLGSSAGCFRRGSGGSSMLGGGGWLVGSYNVVRVSHNTQVPLDLYQEKCVFYQF